MVRRDELQEKYHQPQWKYIHVCGRAGVWWNSFQSLILQWTTSQTDGIVKTC